MLLSWSTQRSFVKSWDCWTRGFSSSVFFVTSTSFHTTRTIFDSHFVSSLEYSLTFIYCLQMLSVIEPDGAENFSIGQIIQVRELKVPISYNRRRLDITTIQIVVFCYQNCSYLLWEKKILVIENFFWNSRLKAENLQKFWDH